MYYRQKEKSSAETEEMIDNSALAEQVSALHSMIKSNSMRRWCGVIVNKTNCPLRCIIVSCVYNMSNDFTLMEYYVHFGAPQLKRCGELEKIQRTVIRMIKA